MVYLLDILPTRRRRGGRGEGAAAVGMKSRGVLAVHSRPRSLQTMNMGIEQAPTYLHALLQVVSYKLGPNSRQVCMRVP